VKDSIQNVEVLVRDNNTFDLKTLLNGELNFVYRGSVIKENPERMIVLSATFQLHQATDPEVIQARAVYQEKINHRKSRHPLEYPNCGSIFKNIRDIEKVAKIIAMFPEIKELVEKKWYGKVAVAYFIEKFGLKGYRVGDAQISDKHALFIVNLGNAKAKDVLTLINMVQSKFIETFGFQLEVEVEIVA
jgi:UDP-N-acetylmuramate dehydrogenase